MNPLPYLAAAFGSLILLPITVAAESAAHRADTAKLTTLGCEMGRAYARQDLTTLDKLNAEDYTQTDTRGIAGWKRHVFQNTWVNLNANQPMPNSSATR